MITMNDLVKLGYLKNTSSSIQTKRGNIRYEKNYTNAYHPFEICWYQNRGMYQGGSYKYHDEEKLVQSILREVFLPKVYKISKSTKQFFESMEPLFKDRIEGKYNPDLSVLPENYGMRKFLEKLFKITNLSPEEQSKIIFDQEIVYKGSDLGKEKPRLSDFYQLYLLDCIEDISLDKKSLDEYMDLYNIAFRIEKYHNNHGFVDRIFNCIIKQNNVEAFKYLSTKYKLIPDSVNRNDNLINYRSIRLAYKSFGRLFSGQFTSGTLLDKLEHLYTYCRYRGEQPLGRDYEYNIIPSTWIRLAKLYHYNDKQVLSLLKTTDEEIKSSFDDLDEEL